ncbi:MAG TPA: BON domain-containing protein [Isosphaeraceae bacterium]|nr:BON domain-containing protein [Isosphaeraceae bacterium]
MTRALTWLGLGAGLMYYFDPDRGRSRRARARDRVRHTLKAIDHEIDVTVRDLSNRAHGVAARARSLLADGRALDTVIVARVRSRLGHVIAHPHAVEVSACGGHVVLSGPVLARERRRLLGAVASVPGVASVTDRLQVYQRPGDHPALRGEAPRTGGWPELRPRFWSPTMRLLAGTALVASVLRVAPRGRMAGLALGLLGAGLAARHWADSPGSNRRGPGGSRSALATGAPIHDVRIPIGSSRMEEPDGVI